MAKPAYYDAYKSILRLIGVTEIKDERTRSAIVNAMDVARRSNALYNPDSPITSTEGLREVCLSVIITMVVSLKTFLKVIFLRQLKMEDDKYV